MTATSHPRVVIRPSPRRVWVIAQNTMTEVIRQKFFYILVIFSISVLTSASYFSDFSFLELDRVKFIKDFCLAAIKLFGVVIAMVGTAQLLPLELDNRTIYPVLAKPVYRGEFLLGKFVGMITLLLFTTLLMSLIFAGVLKVTEHQLIDGLNLGASTTTGVDAGDSIRMIQRQIRDPGLIKALALIYMQMVMVCGITLFVATFATSVIFSVISSILIYITGHLEATARASWTGNPSPVIKFLMVIITFLVPDMGLMDISDNVVNGQHVPLDLVLRTMGYATFYTVIVLMAAHFIFEEKEI